MTRALPSPTKATIIIAAYNESSVIRHTLQSLLKNQPINNFQILVICNGCSDNTEHIIQNEFNTVLCHTIPQASKSLAIRYAESLNPGFPRLYLDADIALRSTDATSLIQYAENQPDAALIIPSSLVDTQHCDALVKRFYRAWYNTPFVRQLGFGAGTYLLNQAARSRFHIWPELIADDGFIRSQFLSQEIHVLKQHQVRVKAPKNTNTLIKVKARSKLGNIELREYLSSTPLTKLTVKKTLKRKTHSPNTLRSSTLDALVYFAVNVCALILAKWQYFTGSRSWSRDNSNR